MHIAAIGGHSGNEKGWLAMSRVGLLLIAIAMAGCSSGGNTIFERMAPMVQQQVLGGLGLVEETVAESHEMTPTELEQIPYATISMKLGDNPAAFIVPIADNRGYLAYQDSVNRGIVMHGGLVTATHGFGHDLDSVAHRHDDPVFTPTPPQHWPAILARSYGFNIRGESTFEITVQCTSERGPAEVIEIVERRFNLLRMVESCSNMRRQFTNAYWVDPGSGFIWKSEQWVGPHIPAMTVEIVRPYSAK